MPKSSMTKAVRRAYEREAQSNQLQAAQELIQELRDEIRQLREMMASNRMSERAKQALLSKRTWRCP